MSIQIPLVDLRAQYQAYKAEFDAALSHCLENTSFIGGPDRTAFIQEFAQFCGGGHVAVCGNGTDALYLSLVELLGQGDGTGEAITVSHTFIATSEAISLAGYRPIFVDIEPDTYLMDVSAVEKAISPRTKAIIVVHLYGQMAAMDKLMAVAERYNLPVVEDSAQAHGATWQGKGPGHWGDAACFSFFPGKNLGAWGDGGAVFTRDAELAARIGMRANHGRSAKYEHSFEGVNSRLDGLQAAILRVKLRYLKDWNQARRQVARWYDELLEDIPGVRKPVIRKEAEPVFHLYVIEVDQRDRILESLRKSGIGAGIHYPIPLHEQPAYQYLEIPPESLPVTYKAARRILSLPIYPEITRSQVETVADALHQAIAQIGTGS